MRQRLVPAAHAIALLVIALAWPSAGGAADVRVGVNVGVPLPPPPIVVAGPPQLVVVPGSPVFYAPSLSVNFFAYGGRYYTFHEGAWFWARSHRGPWVFVAPERVPRPVLAVPVAYYKVPPGHMKHAGGPHGRDHGHRGRD